MTTTAIPKSVSDFLQRITDLCGTEHADWAENFNACFADTLTTTVKRHDDGTTFLLTGERVRKISERVDAIDYGDIFRARFGNASKILYELLIIVFAIPTIISQFAAAGSSVQSLTGISYNVAIPMIAVVLTIYTMSGGMNSVALTDYIQGIIMIAGFGILAAILLTRAGGFTAMHEGLSLIHI